MKAKQVEGVEWTILCLCLAVITASALLCSCKATMSPDTGYRALLIVRDVGDAASKALGEYGAAKHAACQAAPTPSYKECIASTKKILETWTTAIKPAVNSALKLARAALETARQAKKTDMSWLNKIKPAVCGLVQAVKEWKEFLGESKLKAILGPLDTVEGLVCP